MGKVIGSNGAGGKGSGRRPTLVDEAQAQASWDAIFGKKDKGQHGPEGVIAKEDATMFKEPINESFAGEQQLCDVNRSTYGTTTLSDLFTRIETSVELAATGAPTKSIVSFNYSGEEEQLSPIGLLVKVYIGILLKKHSVPDGVFTYEFNFTNRGYPPVE